MVPLCFVLLLDGLPSSIPPSKFHSFSLSLRSLDYFLNLKYHMLLGTVKSINPSLYHNLVTWCLKMKGDWSWSKWNSECLDNLCPLFYFILFIYFAFYLPIKVRVKMTCFFPFFIFLHKVWNCLLRVRTLWQTTCPKRICFLVLSSY